MTIYQQLAQIQVVLLPQTLLVTLKTIYTQYTLERHIKKKKLLSLGLVLERDIYRKVFLHQFFAYLEKFQVKYGKNGQKRAKKGKKRLKYILQPSHMINNNICNIFSFLDFFFLVLYKPFVFTKFSQISSENRVQKVS